MIANRIERQPPAGRSRNIFGLVLAGALLALPAAHARGLARSQQKQTNSPASQQQQPAAGQSDSAKPAAGQQVDHRWDPFNAEKDVEVGEFYMHKGDYDAAISRFEHAIGLSAKYAKPRLLMAECYEKKDDPENAVKYYKEYLQVFPHAPDAKKVRKRIEKLSKP